jgi:putative transposase
VVDRFYPSSKTCSVCGHPLASLSLPTRRWTCSGCGTRRERDINAAKNIKKTAGFAVSACGGMSVGQGFALALLTVEQELPDASPVGIPVLQVGIS